MSIGGFAATCSTVGQRPAYARAGSVFSIGFLVAGKGDSSLPLGFSPYHEPLEAVDAPILSVIMRLWVLLVGWNLSFYRPIL